MVFRLKGFLLFVCLASSSSWAFTKPSYYPVIIVPGSYSSPLEAKLDKPSVILPFCQNKTEDFVPLYYGSNEPFDCVVENMRLFYDQSTRHTKNQEGVEIRVPGFGSSSVLGSISGSRWNGIRLYLKTQYPTLIRGNGDDTFQNFIDELSQLGYKDNISLRGAPYDFRRGLNELDGFYANLKELVQDTYQKNRNTKVVFVGHNLGSVLVTLFLNQQTPEFRETYVQSLISLGGAFGGYVAPVNDYLLSFPDAVEPPRFTQNFSSRFAQFPNLAAFSKDYVIVETPSKKYRLSNIEELFQDLKQPVPLSMYQDNYPIMSNLQAPGVELHCLYGNATSTLTRIIYRYPQSDYFPKGQTERAAGFGDGLIPVASSRVCANFGTKQKQPVHDVPLPDSSHADIIKFGKSFDYIKKVIKIN